MHILLADSDKKRQQNLASALTARGYQISLGSSIQAVLNAVATNPDIGIAVINEQFDNNRGFETCWHLRLLAGLSRPLYILGTSSSGGKASAIQGLDSGADDFIALPADAEILEARLRSACRLILFQREHIRASTLDPLTSISNRRAFIQTATSVLRPGSSLFPVSLILLDIDHFKSVNDTYGHEAGDIVIRHVAGECKKLGDLAARLGGEEFAVLLPKTSQNEAYLLGRKLRQALKAAPIDVKSDLISITASIGVSVASDTQEPAELLRRADIAMYRSKRVSRDRVTVYTPEIEALVMKSDGQVTSRPEVTSDETSAAHEPRRSSRRAAVA